MIRGQPITIGGGSGVGEMPITENGIYNVTNYASVNVNTGPVLLWENFYYTSSFNQQTIDIDSAGYDSLLIEMAENVATATNGRISEVSVVKKSEEAQIINSGMTTGRYFSFVNDSKVSFGMGLHYVDDQYDEDNSYGIPIRIWGVKFSL